MDFKKMSKESLEEMKRQIEETLEEREFKPFELKLNIESRDEFLLLYHLTYAQDDVLKRMIIDSTSCMDTPCSIDIKKIWEQIKQHINNIN